MAQVAIREFDAKKMYFESIGEIYHGTQIKNINDIQHLDDNKKYVIKPDMLFGKRGKRGLLGLNLTKTAVNNWLEQKFQSLVNIDGIDGSLQVFLAEEFCSLHQEYFICFSAERLGDTFTFSSVGGIDIEENWDKTQSYTIATLSHLTTKNLGDMGITETKLQKIILSLWNFYKNYGFVYLEINPLGINETGALKIVDMVAKVDDQEGFKQKKHWNNLEIPNSFGFQENIREQYIRKLDSQTGASLKFTLLNKEAKIWTLLAGGGGSLIITDSLGALGYANEIGNYGELSGNPDREFTREYTTTLLDQMLENKIKGKYLIIAGAIANFTRIDTTFAGIIDVLTEKAQIIREQEIQILVRRGGLNEKKGLARIEQACKELCIPIQIADSSEYMTDILKKINI